MPHRSIDTPLEKLPSLDEYSIEVNAPAEASWAALFPTLTKATDGKVGRRLAERLQCEQTDSEGDLHHPGGTLPGFVVSRAVAPVMLALLGEHRFSSYALVVRIDLLPAQRSRVRIETRASFPGARGRIYRSLVIGTGGHRFAVHGMLRAIRKRAELSTEQG